MSEDREGWANPTAEAGGLRPRISINDLTTVRESTPAWAIVVALLGFFVICALSLLLLLVKETRVEGTIQITVVFGDRFFTTQVPVRSRSDVVRIHQQFHYVRSLTC
ncbi:hypothetical protein [Thermobifida fusca]|uniref:hypothetical protein n=1 Tax=Thermobifida fusca TaxID=2021 RepID=UPI001D0C51D1|nr:hypothetical protein [Thermobifida fusca]